jgi:hypothetical protein
MALQTSSVTIATIAPVAERRRRLKRERLRDFAGVAVGVAVGAFMWLALLSFVRFPA